MQATVGVTGSSRVELSGGCVCIEAGRDPGECKVCAQLGLLCTKVKVPRKNNVVVFFNAGITLTRA